MSIDVKSDYSENETPSPNTTPPAPNHHHDATSSSASSSTSSSGLLNPDAAAWAATNYPSMFWNPQPLREKMLQPSFDPQLYGRWPQMGDASGFYSHPDIYSSFGIPPMTTTSSGTTSSSVTSSQQQQQHHHHHHIVDVKPPHSNGSSSGSDMYPSPDMTPFGVASGASTSSGGVTSSSSSSSSSSGADVAAAAAAAAAAAEYQMRAATCYQQAAVWPFMDYQQQLSWKMPLGKDRRALGTSSSKPLPTGPGTNNIRVRTQDKYRMVYSEYQRLELEKEFITSPFINSDRKSQLSTLLSLTERQIKIWFQNRRAKQRRDDQKHRL